ncbi:MAG: hypothetical protein AB1453_02920 [Chloroflexota bacterium]
MPFAHSGQALTGTPAQPAAGRAFSPYNPASSVYGWIPPGEPAEPCVRLCADRRINLRRLPGIATILA